MEGNNIEAVGVLSALMYGGAHPITSSLDIKCLALRCGTLANFRSDRIHKILKRRVTSSVIFLTATLALSARAQLVNTPLNAPIPAILFQPPAESALTKQTPFTFLKLPSTPPQETQQSLKPPRQSPQRSPKSLQPKPKTMLSISSYDRGPPPLSIRCRTNGFISNRLTSQRVVIKAVVTEDVAASGKILIPAGSKVAGIGQIDPDSGRLESSGNWSIITDFQEVRVHAELQDVETGFHGIQGNQISFNSEHSQTQAIAPDRSYSFVPDETAFILSITGSVAITVLEPLEALENSK